MNSEGQTERQSESKEGSKSRSGKRWSVVEPKSCFIPLCPRSLLRPVSDWSCQPGKQISLRRLVVENFTVVILDKSVFFSFSHVNKVASKFG